MEQINGSDRNFDTISPSAFSLLLMKGYTNIPFTRRAAELLVHPHEYVPDYKKKEMTFWARLLHFESRYWSIDQLMEDLQVNNILELASGFSFRGLEAIRQKQVHYIDTDLPDLIAIKKEFISALKGENFASKGNLELLSLNALDEQQFQEIIARFPDGEIVIVNEGLLMYLDLPEKEKLCSIIHRILKERGGYWITADIYLKKKMDNLDLKIDDNTKAFFEQHRIEENKFESVEEAESFFKRMGFKVDKEANLKRSELSSMKYFLKNVTVKQLFKIRKTGKMQMTWRLRVDNN
jgi:O-methyltransferase involved in polyketide biosynthesis